MNEELGREVSYLGGTERGRFPSIALVDTGAVKGGKRDKINTRKIGIMSQQWHGTQKLTIPLTLIKDRVLMLQELRQIYLNTRQTKRSECTMVPKWEELTNKEIF